MAGKSEVRRVDVVLTPHDYKLFEELCRRYQMKKATMARILLAYAIAHPTEALTEPAGDISTTTEHDS